MDRLQEAFNQSSEKAVLDENGPITEIYVDLEYLQDLRFGALLHTVSVKKEMEYINFKLPEYNQRLDYNCASYFPALGKTEEDLDNLLMNRDEIDLICFKAPFTSMYYEFTNMLVMITHHNHAVSSKRKSISIHVNVNNKLYPNELLKEFKAVLQERFTDITVNFTKEKPYTCPLSDYTEKQLLYIYNIEEFLKQDSATAKAFVADGKFFDKKIISFPYVNRSVIKNPEDDYLALRSTRAQLDVYCDFQYVRSTIPINKPKQ